MGVVIIKNTVVGISFKKVIDDLNCVDVRIVTPFMVGSLLWVTMIIAFAARI